MKTSVTAEVASPANSYSPWPFFLALAVAVPMFFLIGLGGLVTTQDAGMAVPDWPGTYGYNMFLYPVSAWLYGPIDLFVEHGHRLLGSLVGFLSIVFCVVARLRDRRSWVFSLTIALLLCIIFQGLLGGLRVRLDARTLAMIHGCFAPLVFAFACAMVLVTSQSWLGPIGENQSTIASTQGLRFLLQFQTAAAVVQLFVGARLRHTLPSTPPAAFTGLVHTHLTLAFIVTILIILTTSICERRFRRPTTPTARYARRCSRLLFVLVVVQVMLGLGTWIVNYALPWGDWSSSLAEYTIAMKGYWESWITTFHQATGSLIIALSLVTTLLVFRHRKLSTETVDGGKA